ncbi:MAG: 3-deoxy-7-phosphoheptulonate synthase [Spirochaetes bacterium]|nr:3-deoxy-7-phosphoheptulonate synthase [Spirochaetota bacterium]
MKKIDDINISSLKPIITPFELKKLYPMTEETNKIVSESRRVIREIIQKKDKRLLAVIGPCSIHDEKSAMDYAEKLYKLSKKVSDKIFIVMRVYFEKPRTTIGWKGIITDPFINGSYNIEEGLKIARKILFRINSMGLPAGSEMLDPIIPQYISDQISWAAIGARTTESQTHREMTSGLSMPIGFKNGTSGNIKLAVDAMESARHHHCFIGIDQNGMTCIINTNGNKMTHVILRGGKSGPNYHEENIEETEELMKNVNLEPVIMVDCSHENSGKKANKQFRVLKSLINQRINGTESIIGFMIESNLYCGSQKIGENVKDIKYGVSITDECIGWKETEEYIMYAYDKLN